MKTRKYIITAMLLLVAVAAAVLVGCKKENDGEKQNASESSFVNFHGFDVKVQNNNGMLDTKGSNWLCFATRKDYEKAVQVLTTSRNDEILPDFEDALSFNSMRRSLDENEREAIDIEDDVLATLLNPNGVIQIDNYLFDIDVYNDVALVYDLNKDGNPMKFSTKDDFFGYLDGEEDDSWKATCDAKNKDQLKEWHGEKINYKVVYQHALVYFSLQSKIQKTHNGGTVDIFLHCLNYNEDPGYSRYKVKGYGYYDIIPEYSASGNKSSYHYRPYSSTKRLIGFHFKVYFGAVDQDPSNYGSTSDLILNVDCGNN